MRIGVINYLTCPLCYGNMRYLIHKRTKERIHKAKLMCEKCGKKFYIKNDIACFVPLIKKFDAKRIRQMRKMTLEQEIPKKWMQLFLKKEIVSLQKEWNWMSSVIKKGKDTIHLDFATGTGRFLRSIISKTKGEIIALEHDYPTCLELQYFLKKIKKNNRVSIICADARKMPFKDGTFDSVSSWHGLDEPKMEKAIKEARRVLKDGDRLTVSGVHYQINSKSFSIAKKHNIQFITKEIIVRTLKETGFRKIKYKTFFQGKWNEKGSYLPVFGDFYSTYAIKAER